MLFMMWKYSPCFSNVKIILIKMKMMSQLRVLEGKDKTGIFTNVMCVNFTKRIFLKEKGT